MTAVAENRERASGLAESVGQSPAPDPTPDQAIRRSESTHLAPGSGPNGQQARHLAQPIASPPAVSNGQGQPHPPTTPTARSVAPAWHELRVFAELYADVQQTRIACANRAERGGLDPMVLASQLAGLKDSEHQLGLALVRCYRRIVPAPIREWQAATVGIGDHTLARLLGAIGDPRIATPYHWEGEGSDRVLVADEPFERNVAKLWAYCGHGDPSRRRRKGMTAEDGAALGNPRAKMLVHLLAEASMKCVGTVATQDPQSNVLAQPADTNGDGSTAAPEPTPVPLTPSARRRSPYRDTYEQTRERYVGRVDDDGKEWTPAHQHAAALRLVGKEILRDLWLAAGDREGFATQARSVPGGRIPGEAQTTIAAGEHQEEEAATS